MAQTVKTFPAQTSKGGSRKYPWEKWTNGKIWEVRRGEDFQPAPVDFRSHLYARARVEGVKVKTYIDGDTVTFQFFK